MLCSRWLARYDAASLLAAATISLAPGGTARRMSMHTQDCISSHLTTHSQTRAEMSGRNR